MSSANNQISTVDEIQSYLRDNRSLRINGEVIPHVICSDGFKMSVQVGRRAWGLCCTPKNDEGPWSHVEVGYPSAIEPLLWPYAAKYNDADCISSTEAVYPYTPIELVAAVIDAHGGLVWVR